MPLNHATGDAEECIACEKQMTAENRVLVLITMATAMCSLGHGLHHTAVPCSTHVQVLAIQRILQHSNLGKKSFDSILATESIFFDSIRQSDKFAACTLIFK